MKELIKEKLFGPWKIGDYCLKNRIIMAPMTRQRASESGVPTSVMKAYYTQRASVGLVIAEATYTRVGSIGYLRQPGAISPEQVNAWKKLIFAVHEHEGVIVVQLMDAGLKAPSELNESRQAKGPCAIRCDDPALLEVFPSADINSEMSYQEVKDAIDSIVNSAIRLLDCGADGVELHAANGYLLHQFLDPVINQRTDDFGGNLNNRLRILSEAIQSIRKTHKNKLIGIRISPQQQGFVSPSDNHDVHQEYIELVMTLKDWGADYVSIIPGDLPDEYISEYCAESSVPVLMNSKRSYGETDYSAAIEILKNDFVSGVVTGRQLASNPNLVEQWKGNLPLNAIDYKYLYEGEEKGYIDYE